MGYKISGTTITLTRGDTFETAVKLIDNAGYPYDPVEGDKIRFAMKEDYDDNVPCLEKDIPIDTMILRLDPADTKELKFGTYVYDIQFTSADGRVDTFIAKAKFKLTEEVN